MNVGGFIRGRTGRCVRLASLIATTGCVALVLPAASGASVLAPWGSSLSATPTLDTANGASSQFNDEPLSSWNGDSSDNAVSTNFSSGCVELFGSQTLGCTNWMHDGADNTIWNTSVAGGSATAPAGGQVLQINLKGCAVRDDSAPAQTSNGVPVNTVNFQTLTGHADGSYTASATAALFQLPFCQDLPDGANHITTFYPIHMCVAPGDTVGFYDIGGFILGTSGPSWYPQGVPFRVIAPVSGSNTNSFTDADISGGVYAPGSQPKGNNSGFGAEQNQEVMLQVVEGVGDDAYGLCPGGDAVEPTNSNSVVCVTRSTNPGDPYGSCDPNNQPVFPAQNTAPPTIAVSTNGTPVTGSPVPGNRIDMAHGSWTNNPFGYHEQWVDCDANGANCSPIAGATNPYYYITNNDVGHAVRVQETASNYANTEGPAGSGATAAVAGPNAPVITNLKLNPSTWNAAGSAVITYDDSEAAAATIQVLQNGTVVKTLTHTDIAKQYGGNGLQLGGLVAGNYVLQVSANNRGTVGPAATLSFTVTSATPVISNMHINPGSFNSARGATVTYIDSQSGNATLRVLDCKASGASGKNNKRKKKKHGKRQQPNLCAKVVKTLHRHDRAGANGLKLNGVPAGHYQLEIVSVYYGYKATPMVKPFTAKPSHGK